MIGLTINMIKINKQTLSIYYFIIIFISSINYSYASDNSKWLSINKKGMQAYKERNFINAEEYYLKAITEARKSNLGPELSATLNNLGLLKMEVLQFKEAEVLINESLKIRLQYLSLIHI